MTDLPAIATFFDSPRAPNPRRVRMVIAEKGITLPTVQIDIMAGAHRAAEYKGRMGAIQVPGLALEDGTTLTETTAISRYIEALYPEPNLMGRDPLEAAVIEMWSRRIEFGVLMPVAQVLRHGNPAMAVLESPQCPEWAAINEPKVASALRWLEKRLTQTPWIAGERFTLADITALVTVEFMRAIRTKVPEDHVGTLDWMARIRERPGYVP